MMQTFEDNLSLVAGILPETRMCAFFDSVANLTSWSIESGNNVQGHPGASYQALSVTKIEKTSVRNEACIFGGFEVSGIAS